MRSLNLRGDNFTYPFVLKSISQLCCVWAGKCVHGLTMKEGLEVDVYVGTSLVDMYVKCGEIGDARKLFDEMPVRDVASWNMMIAGYMSEGEVGLAREVFDGMPVRNIVSWTSIISGYAQNGYPEEALQLFDEMLSEDSRVKPNWVTVMSVLPACNSSSTLVRGKKIHDVAKSVNMECHPSVQTALVGMYARCGSIADARDMFDRIRPKDRNSVAWNSMISGYASKF